MWGNFGGFAERDEFWSTPKKHASFSPKKLWKERQKNSDAFRESLNNRACFSYLSYFHAIFLRHVLAVLVCQGTLCPVVSGVVTLYQNTSHGGSTSRCPSSSVTRFCHFSHVQLAYVSYEFAAFDAQGIVALVNSHKEALKGKNFQQVQSIRSKLCVFWKAIYFTVLIFLFLGGELQISRLLFAFSYQNSVLFS